MRPVPTWAPQIPLEGVQGVKLSPRNRNSRQICRLFVKRRHQTSRGARVFACKDGKGGSGWSGESQYKQWRWADFRYSITILNTIYKTLKINKIR